MTRTSWLLGSSFKLVELIEEGVEGARVLDAELGGGERVHDAIGDGLAAADGGERGGTKGGWCRVKSGARGCGRGGFGRNGFC